MMKIVMTLRYALMLIACSILVYRYTSSFQSYAGKRHTSRNIKYQTSLTLSATTPTATATITNAEPITRKSMINSFKDKYSNTALNIPAQFMVNITERTTTCLDFQVVLDAVKDNTITAIGPKLIDVMNYENSLHTDINIINENYALVDQLIPNMAMIPLHNSMNVWPVLTAIELNTSPPESDELAHFAGIIEEIVTLYKYMIESSDKFTLFASITSSMKLPTALIETFTDAFDDDGNLNGNKYPTIKKLRSDANALKSKIITTIKRLLNSQDMKEKLADSGYQEIDGRFCLMLKNTYKKGVGIVHGSSNTGRSLYVEPLELVEPTNEMKSIYAQLKAEENRIFYEMCKTIASNRHDITVSVTAIGHLDIIRAKAKIGIKLNGIIPEVGDEGIIRCVEAKHPVLLLRGTDTIGNRIELSPDTASALVISGPNAGGKTVVLKTAGLFALMIKHSIPIPAKYGARIDIFNVMADIGDMQTVSGDLSTFSGHLCVCREMLLSASTSKINSLVLLDEIGTGTDPAQGAALAQAVLEELLNLGTRVIVTTHYQRVKELASGDARFQIAAMEFINSRPTYRLRIGSVGESYALEAGKRMSLPDHVLERANDLLDDESKRLIMLQRKLEEETELAREKQLQYETYKNELAAREAKIEEANIELQVQINKLRDGRTDEFLEDLKIKEKEIELIIRRAEEIALQADVSKLAKEKMIDEARESIKATRIDTEKAIVEVSAEDLATPLVAGEPIDEGTTLIVLERGSIFGSRGIVTQKNKGRGRVVIRIAGVEVKMERHLLGVPLKAGKFGFMINGKSGNSEDNMSSKDKKMMKMLQDDLIDPDKLIMSKSRSANSISSGGIRTTSNTLDLSRTLTLLEAQDATTSFIEKMMGKRTACIYIHHGVSKTNADLKAKYRSWLKRHAIIKVGSVRSASVSDGGDAYTFAMLVSDLDF